ncbi:Carboxylesterase [Myxozyma melibiosi]|uniref:Carboxylesterase n=1 Tax=Myxozyma melibiosi TaxID=54550 RepID=A0ABR1FF34_9ASCO
MSIKCVILSLYFLVFGFTTNTLASFKCSCDSTCQATTTTGKYTGTLDSDGVHFLSIRYAEPPTGKLRFSDPTVFVPSKSKKYDGTALPPYCPQGVYDNESEDCLFLNVFRPTPVVGESALHVFVWVHGGSFAYGGSADPVIYGAELAKAKNMIVVTLNYRLGVLGLFDDGNNTNYAIKDVILALKWVKNNIALFHGNPSTITVGGQSSGATLIRALLSTSEASGLFTKAIMMSDPADYGFNTRTTSYDIITAFLYNQTGCSDISCMRALEIDNILTAQNTLFADALAIGNGVSMSQPMVPVIDKDLIYEDFSLYVADGKLPVQVPLLMGVVKDEANPTIESILSSAIPSAYYAAVLDEFLGDSRTVTVVSSGLFPVDESSDDGTRLELAHVATLFYWTCPVQAGAVSLAETYSKDIYLYEMGVGITYPSDDGLSLCSGSYVCHEADLYPLFGTFNSSAVTSAQKALSAEVQERWSKFIKTGNPNGSKYKQWNPVEGANSANALLLGSETFNSSLYQAQCAIMGSSVPFDYQLYSQS